MDARLRICGLEIDAPTFHTMEGIRQKYFPDAPIQVTNADFTSFDPDPGFQAAVCSLPYGIRIGEAEEIGPLCCELGAFLSLHLAGARAGIYTVNHDAAPLINFFLPVSEPLLSPLGRA